MRVAGVYFKDFLHGEKALAHPLVYLQMTVFSLLTIKYRLRLSDVINAS